MTVSEARKKAIKKYEDEKIEKKTLRMKKGTQERIRKTGAKSINGYITDAIEEKLKRDEAYNECLESHLKALEEMDAMTDEEVRKILEDEDL